MQRAFFNINTVILHLSYSSYFLKIKSVKYNSQKKKKKETVFYKHKNLVQVK